MYLEPAYVPGTSMCTWYQHIYLEPLYANGTEASIRMRNQYTYREPVCVPGISICTWSQRM